MRNRHAVFFVAWLSSALVGCQHLSATAPSSPFADETMTLEETVLAGGFEVPFDVAIVAENDFFVSDRIGKLFRYRDGVLTEIEGVPPVTTFRDPGLALILHGGLMDVELHPRYPDVPWIYLVLFHEGRLSVLRVQVDDTRITEREEIFVAAPDAFLGNGSRIVWQDDEHFFLGVGGTTFSTVSEPVLLAQDLWGDWGKIHRLRADGSVPTDNPVFEGFGDPGTIWSYGHRDSQGLWRDPESGELIGVEHGPKGGDEFNVILPGRNYGWPIFSHGIDYSGVPVSTISEAEAMQSTVLPEHHWTVDTPDGGQAIGPAFVLGLRGSNFDAWNGKYLVGSLVYHQLFVYDRETDVTTNAGVPGRIRSAAQLPSGDLLILRERSAVGAGDGELIRLSPR